jgi:serine/threonine protein kinase/tetratricopeptide (TPR) repeat protein
MGEVWLATDTLLNRPVAVKFLQATDNAIYKDLFLSEARMLARLHHPNITLIYDAVFDEAENRFYIMMEYVEGKSLADLIEEAAGPLPLETVLNITIGILQALKYAYSKGIVHRDVKPDNIVIQNGEVKLTDFGLANLVSILAKTKSEYIIGSPSYMPPEQIIGEGIDGRSDLYALGVTLFEMVTGGRRPFNYADRREILMAHIEEAPPSVKEFVPATPVMLERIIARLLAKHPDDRYPSADVVLDLLASIQARQQFNRRYLQGVDPEAKPLIGRTDELEAMEAIWAKTRSSNIPHLLVVKGEAGIGKSRLIVQFLDSQVIDKNFVAVAGRCDRLGAPYTPFAEILASIFERGLVKPATIENNMSRILDQIPGLAPLLNIENVPRSIKEKPAKVSSGLWKTLSDRVPENVADQPLKAQWQFFATCMAILAELGPAVLFLDDAVFLDEPSVALIRFLIRQVQLPLLIIAEYSENSKAAAWLKLLNPAEREILDVPPLTAASVKAYLVRLLEGPVSEAVVNIIEKRSRGNPFYIEEITRQFVEMGDLYRSETGEWRYTPPPESSDLSQELAIPFLTHAFIRQLHKLNEKDRELLALAAILEPGPDFDFDLWLAVLGGDAQRPAAQTALEEALQCRLVRDLGHNRYTFRPSDIAGSLAASIPKSRQRELHHQIANILIQKEGDPLLISYHYEQAGMATESARYLETAGARAIAANAINQAINYYKHAVELVETQSGYLALGNLYRQQGDWAESTTMLQRALELAKQSNKIDQQSRILNDLAFTAWLSDDYQNAAKFASMVLKLKDVSSVERATAQSHLGMISWLLGRLKEAEEWCQKAVDLLVRNGSEESRLAGAYNRLGLVHCATGKFGESRQVTSQALEIRRKLEDHWGEAYCLVSLGQVAAEQGDYEQAVSYFSTASQLFEKIGSNDGIMVVSTEQGRTLLQQGRVTEAVPLLSKALRLAEEFGKRSSYGLGDIYLLTAQADLALGEVERACSSAQAALKLVEAAGNRKHIAAAQAVLAQIFAAQDKRDQAQITYQKEINLFSQIGNLSGLLRTRLKYAYFLASHGDTKMAAGLEQETRAEAARIGLRL